MLKSISIIRIFILLLYLVVLSTSQMDGQYYQQWPMGYDWSETQPFGLSGLDFTGSRVKIIPKRPTEYGIGLNSSFICDENGELILMTNGCAILDKDARVISGGDILNPGRFHEIYCPDRYPMSQGSLMLPDLMDDSFTMSIHKSGDLNRTGKSISPNLYFTLIKNTTNDIYEVRKKNLVLRDEPASYDQLGAIPHIDNKNWWVIEHRWDETNEFLIYKVNKDTAFLSHSQNVGPYLDQFISDIGNISFSPDGTKMSMLDRENGVTIYDFDRGTGLLSNLRTYYEPWMSRNDSVLLDAVCFSPDSKLIYITASVDVYQIDENDILDPIEHIIHMPRLVDDLGWPTLLG